MQSKWKLESNLTKLSLYIFLLSLHFISGVLVPFFLIWGQISFFQLMILEGLFSLGMVLFEIPTGAIADRFGRKISLVLGAGIITLAVIVYTRMPSFYLFAVGELLWALGVACVSGADEALVYDTLKKLKREKESKRILGRYHSFPVFAMMIAAPIGSIIAVYFGLRSTVLLMAVPSFLAVLVGLSLTEVKVQRKLHKRSYFSTMQDGMLYFKNHRVLQFLALDMIVCSALSFFIIWTYQPYLLELGLPIAYLGFVHAALAGSQIVMLHSFERFEKFLRSKLKYLLLSALITGFMFVLLSLNTSLVFAILFLIILSAFGFTRRTLSENYMHKHIPSKHRATTMSTISMGYRLFLVLLYPLIGLAVEWSLPATLLGIGVLLMIFSLFSFVEEKDLLE